MFQRLSKCLMNEADGGSGNGAPAAPAAPAQPPASSAAAPAPVVPVDQLAGVIAEQMASLRNGIFADLRKAGVFKEARTQEAPAPAPQPAPSHAPTPAPAAPAADPAALLALRDAFDDATSELKLTKGQRQLLRDHVMQRRPDLSTVDTLVSDFVKRAGWDEPKAVPSASETPPATQPATQQPATPTPAKPNISDRGAAAPTDLRDYKGVLNSRPLEMTGHDVEALLLSEGEEKGYAEFQAKVLNALSRVRVKPPRG